MGGFCWNLDRGISAKDSFVGVPMLKVCNDPIFGIANCRISRDGYKKNVFFARPKHQNVTIQATKARFWSLDLSSCPFSVWLFREVINSAISAHSCKKWFFDIFIFLFFLFNCQPVSKLLPHTIHFEYNAINSRITRSEETIFFGSEFYSAAFFPKNLGCAA